MCPRHGAAAALIPDPDRAGGKLAGTFLPLCALLFTASATITIGSSLAMGEVPMPGGWMLSTMWLPACGEHAFLGMWSAMTVAMMLPSLAPVLSRCHAFGWPAALVGLGYFLAWTVPGIAIHPFGAALAAAALKEPEFSRAVPRAAGAVVLVAGALQLTAWKARHLAHCRAAPHVWPAGAGSALLHGVHLGLHCVSSCAGLTAILLVLGVMDLRAMALVTAAITAERLAPDGVRVAKVSGAAAIATGIIMVAAATAPG